MSTEPKVLINLVRSFCFFQGIFYGTCAMNLFVCDNYNINIRRYVDNTTCQEAKGKTVTLNLQGKNVCEVIDLQSNKNKQL